MWPQPPPFPTCWSLALVTMSWLRTVSTRPSSPLMPFQVMHGHCTSSPLTTHFSPLLKWKVGFILERLWRPWFYKFNGSYSNSSFKGKKKKGFLNMFCTICIHIYKHTHISIIYTYVCLYIYVYIYLGLSFSHSLSFSLLASIPFCNDTVFSFGKPNLPSVRIRQTRAAAISPVAPCRLPWVNVSQIRVLNREQVAPPLTAELDAQSQGHLSKNPLCDLVPPWRPLPSKPWVPVIWLLGFS